MLEEVSVMEGELVLVHSNLIHSVLEYAFRVWANLLGIVSSYLRMCIKKSLRDNHSRASLEGSTCALWSLYFLESARRSMR